MKLDAMDFGFPAHLNPPIPRMSFGIGHTISGKYRVEHVLGEGGMGIVVAARHLELDELYAIKIMKREVVGSDLHAERRFVAEARAAARLKGTHVARVHDIGRLATGELYMVMEYLRGVDLKKLVRTHGPLPVDIAVSYLLQACEALAEAHALGIIHRDIKPNNLFLIEGGNSIKVLDFGVSKQPVTTAAEHTGTNVILGTLPYMAPEQMLKSKDVDARSDIWSLGVVLYELVIGRVPFSGEGILEVFTRISSERPRPPSSLLLSVPGALDEVVDCCLQVEPARRYRSVQELAFALYALHAAYDTSAAQSEDPRRDVDAPGSPVSDARTTQPRARRVVAPEAPPHERDPQPGGDPPPRRESPFDLADAPAAQRDAGRRARGRTWKWTITGAAGIVLLIAVIGRWSTWQAFPRPPDVVTQDTGARAPEPTRSHGKNDALAREASPPGDLRPASEADSAGPTENHAVPDAASPPSQPSELQEPPRTPALRPPSPPRVDKPDIAKRMRERVPQEAARTQPPTARPTEPPPAPPERVAPADGQSGPASGLPDAGAAGPTRSRYCEATQGNDYPIEVHLKGSSKDDRRQLLASDICRGSAASTSLCCRIKYPTSYPIASPP